MADLEGKTNAALTAGIIGTAGTGLALLNGGLGNMLGGLFGNNCGCAEDHCVNRYELGLVREIDTLKAGIAQRDANTYTDQKLLEVYRYFDGKVAGIERELGAQHVWNQKTEDSFGAVAADIRCMGNEFDAKLKAEAAARCCGDNAIVTYVNGTFYPRLTADVTVGTGTTAATLYNPVTNCGGCGCNG